MGPHETGKTYDSVCNIQPRNLPWWNARRTLERAMVPGWLKCYPYLNLIKFFDILWALDYVLTGTILNLIGHTLSLSGVRGRSRSMTTVSSRHLSNWIMFRIPKESKTDNIYIIYIIYIYCCRRVYIYIYIYRSIFLALYLHALIDMHSQDWCLWRWS